MNIFQCNSLVGPHSGIGQSINNQWLYDSLTSIPIQQTNQCILGIADFHCHSTACYTIPSLFVAFVHPDHDSHSILHFVNDLFCTGWVTLSTRLDYTNYGDKVVGHTTVTVGIHNSTESSVEKFQFKTPPRKLPLRLNSFLWRNFNKVEYGISYRREDDDFGKEPCTGFTVSLPSLTISTFIPDGQTFVLPSLWWFRHLNIGRIYGSLLGQSVPPFHQCT